MLVSINIEDLPIEILHEILSNLNYEDRANLSLATRSRLSSLDFVIEEFSNIEKKRLKAALIGGKCLWFSVNFAGGGPDNTEQQLTHNLTPQMHPRFLHGTTSLSKQLLIFGGTSHQGLYNDLWRFDQTSSYRRLEMRGSYPYPRANFGLAQTENKMIISGGSFQSHHNLHNMDLTTYKDVHVFDVETRHWSQVSTNEEQIGLSPKCAHRATMISDLEMVVFGGAERVPGPEITNRGSNQLLVLRLHANYKTALWIVIDKVHGPIIPPRFFHHQVLIAPDTLFIYGGTSGNNGALSDAWLLKILRHGQEYTARAHPLSICNRPAQVINSFLYPSCLVDDQLVFVGAQSNAPDIIKVATKPIVAPVVKKVPPPIQVQVTKPTINRQLPRHTIGSMQAFQVHTIPTPQPVAVPPPPIPVVPEPPRNDERMRMFILDLSALMNSSFESVVADANTSVNWRQVPNGGRLPKAPVKVQHATLTIHDQKIFLVGGVCRGIEAGILSQPTNSVHILSTPKIVR